MIRQKILYLPHSDCRHARIKPYAQQLGMSVNWDPELRVGKPLEKVFAEVLCYDIGHDYAEIGVAAANARVIDMVRQHRPKYVFWPTMSYEILEETFWQVRKTGAYVVGWFFDDECRFDEYSRWWIPHMDYILTGDNKSIPRYQQLGAKALHLLVTSDPEYFQPTPSAACYEISFVGSRCVADRDRLVDRLRQEGFSVAAFGKGWDSGYIPNDQILKVYSNSKINLCFTKAYGPQTRNQLKSKLFDIAMCGGFLLCEDAEGLEEYFELGKEIDVFSDYADAAEKIRFYLNNDSIRERIANAGRERSTRDHAQHHLFERVFGILERHSENAAGRLLSQPRDEELSDIDRRMKAQYHRQWAEVLAREKFATFRWQDELSLAKRYDPNSGPRIEKARPSVGIENRTPPADGDSCSRIFQSLREISLRFLQKMKMGADIGAYRYSSSCSRPSIYSSAYAIMTLSLYGSLANTCAEDRRALAGYLDSFQSADDGLFYDASIHNALYADCDWWGARHFALHAIPAYTALGHKPRHPFRFLEKYFEVNRFYSLLEHTDWNSAIPGDNDIDNKIMNIGCCLQYSRDAFGDDRAARAVDFLLEYLSGKVNLNTGLWGRYRIEDPHHLSRMVQFGYHLMSLFLYDRKPIDCPEKVLDLALQTQNAKGGFGVPLNSSACEDIDSVDILIKFSRLTTHRRAEVHQALRRALPWIVSNLSSDGGFVFRKNEAFSYGHPEMSSKPNEGSMFATWFRTLCLASLINELSQKPYYTINHSPGLEFQFNG